MGSCTIKMVIIVVVVKRGRRRIIILVVMLWNKEMLPENFQQILIVESKERMMNVFVSLNTYEVPHSIAAKTATIRNNSVRLKSSA